MALVEETTTQAPSLGATSPPAGVQAGVVGRAVWKVRGLISEPGGRVVATGTAWAFGINVTAVLLGMGSQLVLARALGTNAYGLYVYVLAWMGVAAMVGKLELDTAAVRFVGAYHGTANWAALRGFMARSGRIVLGISVAIGALGLVAIFALRHRMPAGYAAAFAAGCLLLPVMAHLQLESCFLQGFRRIPQAQAPNQVVRPAILCVSVGAATWLFGVRLGASGALLLQLVATGAALVITSVLRRRHTPPPARAAEPMFETRMWVQTALELVVIAGAQIVISTQTDVLVVGTLVGTRNAGLYGVASQLAMLVSFGFIAVMFVAQPMIAKFHAQERPADLQRLVTIVQGVSLLASLPVLIVLALLGKWLLSWFGPDFVSAYPVVVILGGGQLIGATVGALAGYCLTMTGHQRSAAKVIVATAVLNLGLTLILTLRFGLVGAAVATSISMLARAGGLTILVKRLLGVSLLKVAR